MIGKLMQTKMVDKVAELITASLSLTAALAWNSAFQKTIDDYPYLKKSGPWIYAILITALSVVIITSLAHLKHSIKYYIIEYISNIPMIIFVILFVYILYIIYISSKENIDKRDNKTSYNDSKKSSNKNAKKILNYLT